MYRLTHAIGGLCGLTARMNASQEIRATLATILMPLKTSHPPPGGRRRLVEVCRLVLGNRRSHAVPSASASTNCEIIYGSEAYGHLKTRKPPPCRRASYGTAAAAASTQGPRKSLRGFEPPAPSIHRDDEEVDSGTGERLGTARRTRPDPSPRERRTISRAVAHDKQRPFFGKGEAETGRSGRMANRKRARVL
ncbi:hypothetical protein B296_00058044 [Ensete ventricosum]|uniref:Uncharacterized protein n=1 Tax=Ensete ventricosum TaxID=4639 RepID=A0A426XDP3_ENSVE|nr:hypothetical protein B296_00058044 [Ensete ventricosum]